MAITLITGLPGHGKGIFSLDTVNKLAIESGRPVYYHNVKDLNLDWFELDNPKDWVNLPEGSIILLDEAWMTFPLRPNTQTPPDHIGQLATHRHKGYDIFIVTQQPSQLDTFVRKLIDRHFHVVRKFGAESANVHEFVGLQPNPQLSRKGSIKHSYKYPKHIYTWYKSAELHTVKTKRPMRVYMLWFGLPLILAAAVWYAQTLLNPVNGDIANQMQEQIKGKEVHQEPGFLKVNDTKTQDDVPGKLDYFSAHAPAVPDFPHTAPIYEDVTKPVNAPYPAACVQSSSKGCQCYTQQGTKMVISEPVCVQIVQQGFFIDWEQREQQATSDRQGAGAAAINGVSGQRPDGDGFKISPNSVGLSSPGSPNNSG